MTDALRADLRERVKRATNLVAVLLAQCADADAYRDGLAKGNAAVVLLREVEALALDLQAAEARLAAQAPGVAAAKAYVAAQNAYDRPYPPDISVDVLEALDRASEDAYTALAAAVDAMNKEDK